MNSSKLPPGGRLDRPGSAADYKTGSWRSGRQPVFIPENCINCHFCVNFCPDQCWQTEGGKVTGVDLTYCKGCGLCARNCPAAKKAIKMEDEKLE